MGLFGVSEVLVNFSSSARRPFLTSKDITWRSLMPSRKDWRDSSFPVARGSLIGAALGTLPGAGATMSAFMSYALEKRIAKEPERFGKGAIEGIAGPEAANNAAAQAAFIPTMTLGIPGNSVMALMLGALIMHGISPGPLVIVENPELFWGLIMSFWIGNFLLLILNIPMIGVWVRILTVPYQILFPAILFFICIGVYSVNNDFFDIILVLIFGIAGYVMKVLDFPIAPLLLGFILGPLMEENLRRAMLLSRGDLSVFVTRPISLAFLAVSLAFLAYATWASYQKRKTIVPLSTTE
ncbi:tripartite tricarboxylate transporter permease, partial [Pseudomonadota bacterium]